MARKRRDESVTTAVRAHGPIDPAPTRKRKSAPHTHTPRGATRKSGPGAVAGHSHSPDAPLCVAEQQNSTDTIHPPNGED